MVEILEGRSASLAQWLHRGKLVLCERTRVHGLSAYSRCPAATMITPRYLQKLSRNLDIVVSILQDLHASFTRVELGPGIAVQFILFACVPGL